MDAAVMSVRLQHWKNVFEDQANSGLSKEEWCKRNGIPRWKFYRRQKELREYYLLRASDTHESADLMPLDTSFVELPITQQGQSMQFASEGMSRSGSIEISHGKFRIRLNGSVDESTLETVIKAVAHVR